MSKQNSKTQKTESNIYKSIRVKESTKEKVTNFLNKVNKSEDCGKISFDDLISFFLENVTIDDIKKLHLRSITWEHEDRRLRKLYEKKKGKISDAKWREMTFLGHIQSFVNEHSRLPVGAA